MISYKEHDGKLYFFETNAKYAGQWVNLKMCSDYEISQKRAFFRKKYFTNKEGALLIKNCAKKGVFNNDMTQSEIEQALQKGVLPDRFVIHHILPLSLGGDNNTSNLCIIHQDLHTALHKEHFNLIRDEWDSEKYPEAYLYIPKETQFLTMKDLNKFFSEEECARILIETNERHKKNEYHQKRKKEIKQKQKNLIRQKRFSKKVKQLTPQIIESLEKKYRHHKKVMARQAELEQMELMPKPTLTYKDSEKFHNSRIKKMRRENKDRE